jgi:hypothetical protein
VTGNGDGWHRASMEFVAYRLSRVLGMDYVPPAAYRRPEVGPCRLTLSNPELNARLVSEYSLGTKM